MFKNVRKSLLKENALLGYVLYAVGEILLVVVGILLALQINNWNEENKIREEERNYLFALEEEFSANKKKLHAVMQQNLMNLENAKKLIKHTGPNGYLEERRFVNLFLGTVGAEIQYRPGSGVLNDLISSGKLNIIRNRELGSELASWDGAVLKIRFQEEEHADPRTDLFNLYETEGNERTALSLSEYKNVFDPGKSRFKQGNSRLLRSLVFENNIIEFIVTAELLNAQYYSQLEKEIDQILILIKKELKSS